MATMPVLKTDELEITPRMEEAGARLIADRFGEPLDWLSKDLAREVYRAMHRHAGVDG